MNELQVFTNEEFGSIRGIDIKGEAWVVGKDVAERLGYKETAKAIRTHVDDEDKGVSVLDTPGGKQKMTIINESGVYSLILSSKLPEAKKFKRWVTSEVLPSIRKHGTYMTADVASRVLTDPDFLLQLATEFKAEKEKNAQLTAELSAKTEVCEMLADNSVKWTDRASANAVVRSLAGRLSMDYAHLWNYVYKELKYKHHMDLHNRANREQRKSGRKNRKPMIEFIKDNEWGKVESILTGLCEKNHLNSRDVFYTALNMEVKGV